MDTEGCKGCQHKIDGNLDGREHSAKCRQILMEEMSLNEEDRATIEKQQERLESKVSRHADVRRVKFAEQEIEAQPAPVAATKDPKPDLGDEAESIRTNVR